jgi:hypothetical protein
MNIEQTITYLKEKDSIDFIKMYFTTMFLIIIFTFLYHCCSNKKPELIDYKKYDGDKDDDVSSSTQDELENNEIDTSDENFSSVFYDTLNLMTKKQLLKIAGLRCKHFNKSAIIGIVMNKLVLNAVETNMYIPKESIKFIRNKQNKMESEFFRINNIKNPEINNRAVDSDTDAVLGTSDNDSNSDVDSSDGDTEVKTT